MKILKRIREINRSPKRACDDYYEPEIFFGFGATYELRDAGEPPLPRLWGMRSVPKTAAIAMAICVDHEDAGVGVETEVRVGFHIPPPAPASEAQKPVRAKSKKPKSK